MKKILASAGMVALGAATLNAASAPTLTAAQTGKPWNVSASLRGFYDDNYATTTDQLKRGSFGFDVSPALGVNLTGEQTQFGASYKFGARYYEDRVNNEFDLSHQFNATLAHQFSERYSLKVYEEFIMAQEGLLLDPAQRIQALRADGDNIRNTAGFDFRADVTRQIALEPGYSFTFYDYDDKGPGRYSARLDRQEHLAKMGVRWVEMLERTDGILGYQFGNTRYTSNDSLTDMLPGSPYISPSERNFKSHYYFIGADYTATAKLTLSGRFGAQTVDYSRAGAKSKTSPYVDLSGSYRFQENSTLQVGYKLARIATDMAWSATDLNNLTFDQQSHFLYGRVSHTISRLTLSGGASYQYGTFRGSALNGAEEAYLMCDLTANYKINEFLSAEAGYTFEVLNDIDWGKTGVQGRDFDRNFVFIGIRAAY